MASSRLPRWIASLLLLLGVVGLGFGLSAWKSTAAADQAAAAAAQPEPIEVVGAALAGVREHRATTTVIGTVLARRSVHLENEVPGTVHTVYLPTGEIVEAGTVLVALDVSVEEAELHALEAGARLTETMLGRMERAQASQGASEADVDRARAERDVALANVARVQAVIDRKTMRAPFRARVGLADLHPGQYIDQGTPLTTLQGVDDTVYVDFSVAQAVSAGLVVGGTVAIVQDSSSEPVQGAIRAVDARVDSSTRNALVRAEIPADAAPAPGSSVRVLVPVGASRADVVVPVSALRKGPGGDHVFVLGADEGAGIRAELRRVQSGRMLGDEVVIESGLEAGERVAATGSFKLYPGALVAVAKDGDVRTAAQR
jgi:membrane fusion protein (multidrug efflux system)